MPNHIQRYRYLSTAVCTPGYVYSTGVCYTLAESLVQQLMNSVLNLVPGCCTVYTELPSQCVS